MEVVDFNLPAAVFRVLAVHAKKLRRKERRLIAARARTNLEHHVFLVVRILRQEQFFEFCRLRFLFAPRLPKLLLRERPKLFVFLLAEHGERLRLPLFGAAQCLDTGDQGRKFRLFL